MKDQDAAVLTVSLFSAVILAIQFVGNLPSIVAGLSQWTQFNSVFNSIPRAGNNHTIFDSSATLRGVALPMHLVGIEEIKNSTIRFTFNTPSPDNSFLIDG